MKLPPLSEFLSTDEEWHTFIVGYCEMFALWTRHPLPPNIRDLIEEEFWYYRLGKFLGAMTWVVIGFVFAFLLLTKILG